MLGRARRHVPALRPDGRVRRSIARSFRAAPELLAFTNDLFSSIDTSATRADAFRFTAARSLSGGDAGGGRRAGCAWWPRPTRRRPRPSSRRRWRGCSPTATVRDRQTGLPRRARPGDIAILFRSRASHREIESALESRGIPTYVYKGLGFFDADEVKDLVALLRYLAQPSSPLRAAALLRSRFVRLSDRAVRLLAPRTRGRAVRGASRRPPACRTRTARVLERLRASLGRWLPLVDRVPPAEAARPRRRRRRLRVRTPRRRGSCRRART